MFGLSWVKVGIYGALISGVVTAVGMGVWHYTSLVDEAAQLRTDKAVLEAAIDLQDTTISAQQQAIAEWERSQQTLLAVIHEMQASQRAAEEESRRLRNVFEGHDLEALSLRRPGLIERRIDDGSARINCLLEHATNPNANGDPDC